MRHDDRGGGRSADCRSVGPDGGLCRLAPRSGTAAGDSLCAAEARPANRRRQRRGGAQRGGPGHLCRFAQFPAGSDADAVAAARRYAAYPRRDRRAVDVARAVAGHFTDHRLQCPARLRQPAAGAAAARERADRGLFSGLDPARHQAVPPVSRRGEDRDARRSADRGDRGRGQPRRPAERAAV